MPVQLNQSGGEGGTTLTGTGIARNTGACTELSGDVTTSGSNAASVVKVNGAAVPATKTVVGTNGSGQIIDATGTALPATMFPALTGDVTTVAGALATTVKSSVALAGSPTTTTQAAFDGSTKIATTAYVDNEVGRVTSAPDYAGIPCDYWTYTVATATTSQNTGTGNTYFVFFTLSQTVTFTKVSVNIQIASNGNHLYIGIYNKAQNSLLVQATFTSTASTGTQTATVASTTLKPGIYCLAFACDNATAVRCSGVPQLAVGVNTWNFSTNRSGSINNPPSGGNLPANLLSAGSFTPASIVPPFVLLEP